MNEIITQIANLLECEQDCLISEISSIQNTLQTMKESFDDQENMINDLKNRLEDYGELVSNKNQEIDSLNQQIESLSDDLAQMQDNVKQIGSNCDKVTSTSNINNSNNMSYTVHKQNNRLSESYIENVLFELFIITYTINLLNCQEKSTFNMLVYSI